MRVSLGHWFEQKWFPRDVLGRDACATDSVTATKLWEGRLSTVGMKNALCCMVDGRRLGDFTAATRSGYPVAPLRNLIRVHRILNAVERQ